MTAPITRQMRKKYIAEGGSNCLNCGSGDITGGFVEIDCHEAWQPITCNECGASWNDIYRMVGVADLEVPDKE